MSTRGTGGERPAVFLDRDGTIIHDEGYLADPTKARLLAGAVDAFCTFRDAGRMLVVVSNQSGIPRGLITPAQHEAVAARVAAMLSEAGVPLAGAYYCPHLPDAGCRCRKPRPGMLLDAARDLGIDLARSLMIGDKISDVEAGRAAGCMTALLGRGRDGGTSPAGASAPDFHGDDWPALMKSMESSWKI